MSTRWRNIPFHICYIFSENWNIYSQSAPIWIFSPSNWSQGHNLAIRKFLWLNSYQMAPYGPRNFPSFHAMEFFNPERLPTLQVHNKETARPSYRGPKHMEYLILSLHKNVTKSLWTTLQFLWERITLKMSKKCNFARSKKNSDIVNFRD